MQRPILFVNRHSDGNMGDILSNPILYFRRDYSWPISCEIHFHRKYVIRKPLALLRDSARAIVIGGGGLLGQDFFREDLDFWTKGPAPSILWGAGHNSHNIHSVAHRGLSEIDYLQLQRFVSIGVRDWNAGFTWVPCASCMHSELSGNLNNNEGVVIALHKDMRKFPDQIQKIASQASNPTIIFNDAPATLFIGTLRGASLVVTNSYHASYWASLLKKRVIAVGGGTKITTLKHSVAIAPFNNWVPAVKDAQVYKDALAECKDRSSEFNHRIVKLTSRTPKVLFSKLEMIDPVKERNTDIQITGKTILPPMSEKVPKIVHFIFGLSSDFGGKPFNFMHYIAVLSAVRKINPDKIIFHYRYLPNNDYFNSIRDNLELRRIDIPSDFGGKVIKHFAHKSDILRLQILHEFGGIYLDLDTISVASFDKFLEQSCTIGVQGKINVQGLCNAVIVAAPKNAFISSWLEHYSSFDDSVWDSFSVKLPYVMWRTGAWPINVEQYDCFHWPLWDDAGLTMMFKENNQFPSAVCHHLWESKALGTYVPNLGKAEMLRLMTKSKSTYANLVREYL